MGSAIIVFRRTLSPLTKYAARLGAAGAGILVTTIWFFNAAWSQDQAADRTLLPVDQKVCVSLNLIQATEIFSDREIVLTLQNGEILALRMPESCPQLKFHGSFTYRATAGRLCAGEDKIVTRSGDACTIGTFALIDSREDLE